MSKQLRDTIYQELSSVTLIDPHTHINALNPASETLADILGYHYYTELAHSAGMPKAEIEEPGMDPKEKVGRLMANLGPVSNTIQYSWFVEMAQQLFGFEGDEITSDNWEPLYDRAVEKMAGDSWADEVLRASNLDGVFLTNDFDDPLEGFDTKVYIPCLRTDDLVFHLAKPEVRDRLRDATGYAPTDIATLSAGIGALFDHFTGNGAKACAISLPPEFSPTPVSRGRAETALAAIVQQGVDANESHRRAISKFVFWQLAERCADYRLPFDLMIGVNRGVYEGGVHQGQDLYDSRVSLIQYKALFNAFPQVTFPVSVLASVASQELASYAWIFPNVVTNGHWWYSNTPTFIEHDASARMEAVPKTKQIGYYSDMYKLEFALPKFNMYKRILAKILAERYVIDRNWSESRAIEFGLQLLRDNSEAIFKVGSQYEPPYIPPPELQPVETIADTIELADAGVDDTKLAEAAGLAGIGAFAAVAADDQPAEEFFTLKDSSDEALAVAPDLDLSDAGFGENAEETLDREGAADDEATLDLEETADDEATLDLEETADDEAPFDLEETDPTLDADPADPVGDSDSSNANEAEDHGESRMSDDALDLDLDVGMGESPTAISPTVDFSLDEPSSEPPADMPMADITAAEPAETDGDELADIGATFDSESSGSETNDVDAENLKLDLNTAPDNDTVDGQEFSLDLDANASPDEPHEPHSAASDIDIPTIDDIQEVNLDLDLDSNLETGSSPSIDPDDFKLDR